MNGNKPGSNGGGGRRANLEVLRESIREEIQDITRLEFWAKLAVDKAIPVLEANMDLKIGEGALRAAQEVLNRALGRPKERTEITGKDGSKFEGAVIHVIQPKADDKV